MARKLIALNGEFYQSFGREFSATRGRIQPGVRRVVEGIGGEASILDLGCGNGSLAHELARRGHHGLYVGLDFSAALLEAARPGLPGNFHFFLANLAAGDLELKPISACLIPGSYNLIFCFATLHHIPGLDLRLGILKMVHGLLAPAGRFIHSEWQFLNSEKLKSRIQPWGGVGLSPADVDPGDYLLDWRFGGRGLRYVHHFDEAELESLAVRAGFRIRETTYSDGENGRLGLYQCWEAA